MNKIGLVVVTALLLSACSNYATNGDQQYLRSRNGVKIVVPPPLTGNNLSYFYNLPPQNKNPRVSIAPPSSAELGEQAV